jgi:hypothetical protein
VSEFKREDLAWAAGFFDGEWSFMVVRNDGSHSPRLTVGQTDPRPLYRFMAVFNGIGNVRGPYTRVKANHSPIWYYSVDGFEKVQALMAMMWPFLCEPKKQQATEMMAEVVPHARAMIEKRQFCPKGHAMTEENTAVYTQGPGWKSRRCRTCTKEHDRKAYERKLARQDAEAELLRQMLTGEAS